MRRPYQALSLVDIGVTPRLGTDGNSIVYPFRGIAQALSIGARPNARTVAYVLALVVAAIVTAVSLILAGYTLEAPLTVLALALAAAVDRAGQRPVVTDH